MNTNTRNNRIDFLRGIAICLVLMLHFYLSYLRKSFSNIFPENLFQAVFINGNYGVTIFFAISGYLITSRSIGRYGDLKNINTFNFYTLRFARIFPCIVLALAMVSVLAMLGVSSFVSASRVPEFANLPVWLPALSVLTFWHNVLMEQYGYFNYALNIYWSLSVEEIFYLFFPVICIGIKRRTWLYALMCVLIITGPIYRQVHKADELFFMYGYLACFDAISFGCLAALLQNTLLGEKLQNKLVQIGAVLLLSCTYLFGIHGNETFGFSLIAIATAILLIGSSRQLMPQNIIFTFILRPVQLCGRLSYELYLFHIIILGLIRYFIKPGSLNWINSFGLFLVYFSLSLSVSYLIFRFYSEPLNQKIRQYWLNIKPKVILWQT